MLMNFNFTNNKCAQSFLTADETEILVQSSKLDKEYELYGRENNATICKSTILQSVSAATELQSIHG